MIEICSISLQIDRPLVTVEKWAGEREPKVVVLVFARPKSLSAQ